MKSNSEKRAKRSAIAIITAFTTLTCVVLAVFVFCSAWLNQTQTNAIAHADNTKNANGKSYTLLGGVSTLVDKSSNPIRTGPQVIYQSAVLLSDTAPVEYTVAFNNFDGTVLSTAKYPLGADVELPADPTRPADAQYTYTFAGWDKQVVAVTEDVTYTATYTSTVNNYTVTWVVGEQSFSDQIAYGTVPVFSGSTDKAEDLQYIYTFAGWDKEVVAVTEAVTYTATYIQTPKEYTVIFKNYDDTVLLEKKYTYGETIVLPEVPTHPNDQAGTFQFTGWFPLFSETCTGDATYTAGFDRHYFFGDANGDGKVSISDILAIKSHIMDKKFLSGDSVAAADMNGNGSVTITDFLLLKDIILRNGSTTVTTAPSTATLAGPGTVRSGDTITLSFNLNNSNLYGASGTLSYDSEQVMLVGVKQKVAAPWLTEINGNHFVTYDDSLNNPINLRTTVITATFQIKDLPAGTPVTISLTNVIASDGNADEEIGTVSYAITVAPPPSNENNLQSLVATNAALSPAFNEKTTTYVTTVPFSTTQLNIKAAPKDSKATVTIDNPSLVADETTAVTITVTAEDGSTKVYTIQVKRQQDPNYILSGDNALTGITVDGYVVSPAFKEDISQYVVWLPYETENITVVGTAAHEKATVTVEGGTNLVAGKDNEIKITCIAENKAEKVYILIAKRAAPHGSDNPLPSDPLPSVPDPTVPATEPTGDETSPDTGTPGAPTDPQDNRTKVMLIVSIIIGVVALTAGSMVGIVIGRKIKR